jgi:addiction module RelE/StbE family toxin
MAADYRIRLTRQALNDIEDIRDFIGQDSQKNAARMIERLFDTFDSLERFPHRAVVEVLSGDLPHPVRSIPVRPYVVYFRVIESERVVVIRHIRHGARRPPEAMD